MAEAHCPQCAAYEARVLGKAPDEALPPDVVPCPAFVMSDRFRDWAVGEMRKEVLGQVSMAGLDRMALLKAKPADVPKGDAPAAHGTAAGGARDAGRRRPGGPA